MNACLHYVCMCILYMYVLWVHVCSCYMCVHVYLYAHSVCMCVSWMHACLYYVCLYMYVSCVHVCSYCMCECAMRYWIPLLKPPFLTTCLWFGNDKPSQGFPYWHLAVHTATVAGHPGHVWEHAVAGRVHFPLDTATMTGDWPDLGQSTAFSQGV